MVEPQQNPALTSGGSTPFSYDQKAAPADVAVANVALLVTRPVLGPNGEPIGTISIEDEGTGAILIARWLMRCPHEVVMGAFLFGMELFEQYSCVAFINYGLEAASEWNELIPWLEYDILPRSLTIGIRAVAIVHSTDPSEGLALYQVMHYVSQHVPMQAFGDYATARRWVSNQLAAK